MPSRVSVREETAYCAFTSEYKGGDLMLQPMVLIFLPSNVGSPMNQCNFSAGAIATFRC